MENFAGIQALLLGRANAFDDQSEIDDQLGVTLIEGFETLAMAIISVAGSRSEQCEFLRGLLLTRAKKFDDEAAQKILMTVGASVARARPGSALERFRPCWDGGPVVGLPMDALKTAIANGCADLVTAEWREEHPPILELLKLAGDFHRSNVVQWLLTMGTELDREIFVSFCLSHRLADSLLVAVKDYRPWALRSRAKAIALGWMFEFQAMTLDHIRIPAVDEVQRSFLLLNAIEFVGQHRNSYELVRELEGDAVIHGLFEKGGPDECPRTFDGWELNHVGRLWLSLALVAKTSITGKRASLPKESERPRLRRGTEADCVHLLLRDVEPVIRRDDPEALSAFLGESIMNGDKSALVVGNFPEFDQVPLLAAAAFLDAPTLVSMLPKFDSSVAVYLAAGLASSNMLTHLLSLGVIAPNDAFLFACRAGSLECMRYLPVHNRGLFEARDEPTVDLCIELGLTFEVGSYPAQWGTVAKMIGCIRRGGKVADLEGAAGSGDPSRVEFLGALGVKRQASDDVLAVRGRNVEVLRAVRECNGFFNGAVLVTRFGIARSELLHFQRAVVEARPRRMQTSALALALSSDQRDFVSLLLTTTKTAITVTMLGDAIRFGSIELILDAHPDLAQTVLAEGCEMGSRAAIDLALGLGAVAGPHHYLMAVRSGNVACLPGLPVMFGPKPLLQALLKDRRKMSQFLACRENIDDETLVAMMGNASAVASLAFMLSKRWYSVTDTQILGALQRGDVGVFTLYLAYHYVEPSPLLLQAAVAANQPMIALVLVNAGASANQITMLFTEDPLMRCILMLRDECEPEYSDDGSREWASSSRQAMRMSRQDVGRCDLGNAICTAAVHNPRGNQLMIWTSDEIRRQIGRSEPGAARLDDVTFVVNLVEGGEGGLVAYPGRPDQVMFEALTLWQIAQNEAAGYYGKLELHRDCGSYGFGSRLATILESRGVALSSSIAPKRPDLFPAESICNALHSALAHVEGAPAERFAAARAVFAGLVQVGGALARAVPRRAQTVALNSGRPIEAVNATLNGATGNTQVALYPTMPGRPLSKASAAAIDLQLRLGRSELEIALDERRTRQFTSFFHRRSAFGDQISLGVDFAHARVVDVMRTVDGAYAILVASPTGASLVARDDIVEFELVAQTRQYVSTLFKWPLLIRALINSPDGTPAFVAEMMPFGPDFTLIIPTSEFRNAVGLSAELSTVAWEEWHHFSDISALNRRWLNEAVRAVDAQPSEVSHTADRPVTIGDFHIAFEPKGMLRFWWGWEEPDELVIIDPPRIERPEDPFPMLSIPVIDDNPLVGGPPWWLFAPVTTRCRQIQKALAPQRGARARFTEGMRAVNALLPLFDRPWERLCVAAEFLFASAMRQDLPTLDDVAGRIGFPSDLVWQIRRDLQLTGPAIFPPIDDESVIFPRRRVISTEILILDQSGTRYLEWMKRLASLDRVASSDVIRIAAGQELLAAIMRDEPEPSGRQIVDSACIRGLSNKNVTQLVSAVKDAAPGEFAPLGAGD